MERNVFWKGEQEKVDKLQHKWYKDVAFKEKTVSSFLLALHFLYLFIFSLKTPSHS